MDDGMLELYMSPFIKCIALKLNPFESEIMDDRNFSCDDIQGMLDFEKRYCYLDDYVVTRIEM